MSVFGSLSGFFENNGFCVHLRDSVLSAVVEVSFSVVVVVNGWDSLKVDGSVVVVIGGFAVFSFLWNKLGNEGK